MGTRHVTSRSQASRGQASRRQFLGQSAGLLGGAIAAPYIFTTARAQDAAPSDRPVIALIGCGGQGRGDFNQAMRYGNAAAVCDVDSDRAESAAGEIVKRYEERKVERKIDQYDDYRRILERKDIDAVVVGTPDHWHVKIAIEAMQAGKDVYCEKPLTLTIAEGQLIGQAVKKYNKVFQVGTQQRSDFKQVFLMAMALIREGRLGKVTKATCAIGIAPVSPEIPEAEAPKNLNWERWLGQAPLVDYRLIADSHSDAGFPFSRCHYNFRWWYEYSGGKMTDWGAHHVDIATWALGLEKTGPSSMKVVERDMPVPYEKGWPTQADRYNTAHQFKVLASYPDAEITITHNTDDGNGILFEGDKGRIHVNRDRIKGKPFEELKDNPLPEDALTKIYKGGKPMGHMENFFDCIKTRKEPISDVYTHHRAMTTCHLANIALRLDRELKWDPVAEKMIGDDEAQTFTSRTPRKGYEITV